MDPYVVPFGVDASIYISGLAQAETATDSFIASTQEANGELQKSFDEVARGNNQLKQSILSNLQAAKEYRKEISSGVVPDLERFNTINTALQANLESLRQKIVRTSDPAQLDAYRKQIQLLDNQIDSLSTTIKNVKPLELPTRGFTESIGIIKNLENELQRLEGFKRNATDPKDIERFNKAIVSSRNELAAYNAIGLAPAASGNKKLGDSANAATLALGNTGRVLQDLPFGFIGISNNLNPLLESFQRLKAETGSSSLALKALGSSLIGAGGIGLALSAITAAFTFASIGLQAWEGHVAKSKKAVDDAKKANDEYMDSLSGVNKALLEGSIQSEKEVIALDNLYRATQNTNLSQRERVAAVDDLQKKFPDYFANFSQEEILAGKAATAYNGLRDAIIATSRARAASNILEKEQEKKLINEQQIADLESQKLVNDQKLKDAKALQKFSAATGTLGISPSANEGVISTLKAIEDAQTKINAKKAENVKIDEVSLKLQKEIDVQQKKGGVLAITGSASTITDQQKKDEAADKKSDAANKKRAGEQKKANTEREAEEKAFNDLLFKLTNDRSEFEAKSIEQDRDQAIAVSDAKYQKLKDNVEKEVNDAKVSEAHKAVLREAGAKTIESIEETSVQARIDINKKYDDAIAKQDEARRKVVESAQKGLAELGETQYDKDIQKVEQHYIQLAATIEKGGLLTEDVQRRISENQQRDIDNINIKYGAEQIKTQTELAVAGIKVSEEFAGKSKNIERAKQIAILEEQLKGAEAQLELLTDNGKDQSDIAVKNAQEVINNIRSAIKGANSNSGAGQSIFDFLGLDLDAQKDVDRYSKAASTAGKVTADFLGGIIDLQQQQIDKKQEMIDQEDRALDDLEARIDKEKELRDAGFANNVDTLQKEFDAKKAQREEDFKQQQELQNRQKSLRKAQLVADSIAQVSNLITAASEIFSAFAGIPFVGIPLAIAAIGVMFGSFAIAKVKAFKAIGDAQSFGEGGWVDGPDHSRGGKKYRSVDGSGGVVELEGKEFVTKKKQAKKYGTLLEAINNDDLSRMNDDSLREMLSDLGIGYSSEAPKQAIKLVKQKEQITYQFAMNEAGRPDISKDVKSISANVNFLAEKERGREGVWQEGNLLIKKKGSKTTRIKIK